MKTLIPLFLMPSALAAVVLPAAADEPAPDPQSGWPTVDLKKTF